jgi:hypothetical protein
MICLVFFLLLLEDKLEITLRTGKLLNDPATLVIFSVLPSKADSMNSIYLFKLFFETRSHPITQVALKFMILLP